MRNNILGYQSYVLYENTKNKNLQWYTKFPLLLRWDVFPRNIRFYINHTVSIHVRCGDINHMNWYDPRLSRRIMCKLISMQRSFHTEMRTVFHTEFFNYYRGNNTFRSREQSVNLQDKWSFFEKTSKTFNKFSITLTTQYKVFYNI